MATSNFAYKVVSLATMLTLVASMLLPVNASAQGTDGDGLKRQFNSQNGKINFIVPENGRALSALKALGTLIRPEDPALALANRYAPEFGVKNPASDLTVMSSDASDDGRIVVHYQQTYQGIPVMGGELIVNTNERGDLYSLNGEASPDLLLSTQPAIDPTQAKETALQTIADQYQEPGANFSVSEPELWIFDESLLQPSTRPVELVWRMEVTAINNNAPVRELVLINAQTGNVSLHFNQIDMAWGGTDTSNDFQSTPETYINSTNEREEEFSGIEHVITENAPTLAPTTWYVSTTGNDTNSCASPASPCLTINGAIGKATAGDMIKVAVGTYTGSGTEVVSIVTNIILSGGWDAGFTAQNGMSTIDGQHSRMVIQIPDSTLTVSLDHFVVKNGGKSGVSGGISNHGNLTINNSAIHSNESYYGGGIYNIGTLVINNSTISNNSASIHGGGIYNFLGTLTINSSTITNNTATKYYMAEGGGIWGDATIMNSILDNNVSTFKGSNCSSTLVSQGNNIINDISGCTVSAMAGDLLNTDPKMGIFLPDLGFHPVTQGSPAIDAGNPATCPAKDQRGVSRPQGAACDIGAYEYAVSGPAATIMIIGGNPQRTAPSMPFANPLSVIVLDGLGTPVSGVTVTFTAPATGVTGVFENSNSNITSAITNVSGIAVASALGVSKVKVI